MAHRNKSAMSAVSSDAPNRRMLLARAKHRRGRGGRSCTSGYLDSPSGVEWLHIGSQSPSMTPFSSKRRELGLNVSMPLQATTSRLQPLA